MKLDYEKISYIIVKGNIVTESPYMGNPRPNALVEDLNWRRSPTGGRAQYVCVLHDGEPIEVTPEVCADHIPVCVSALEKAKAAKKEKKESTPKAPKA